jgi:hypothetical protein
MFDRIRHIFLVILSSLALVSCDSTIHEYPIDIDVNLTVRCSVDLTHPEHFVTVECDAENGTSYVVRTQNATVKGTRFTEPVCLRYVIDLYEVRASNSQFVERRVLFADVDDPNPQAITTFTVDARKYRVLVWCDYEQDDVREAWYYVTDDLTKILYSDEPVVDNNDKVVFTNMLEVDFSEYRYADNNVEVVHDLMLQRPKGRFKCITTDMEDYAKGGRNPENITAVVTYTQYVSAGYNVEEQKPNYFEFERTFFTKARIDEDGELELCYDYVFVNGKQTNVKINFAFFDGEVTVSDSGELIGDKISNWTGVVVPLKRNMETVITGRMLTASFGTGGFGIDPGFEGEIVIPWGD